MFRVGNMRRVAVTDFPGYDHCDGKTEFRGGSDCAEYLFSGLVRGGKRNCGAGVNARA